MNPDITLPKINKVGIYRARLTQSGTNAPDVEVMEDSITPNTGQILNWIRNTIGAYQILGTGLFPADKTFIRCQNNNENNNRTELRTTVQHNNSSVITLWSYDGSGIAADSMLINAYFEIIVYNS